MRDSSDTLTWLSSWYRVCSVNDRAAKPEAEDARPAAVGKLFADTMWMCRSAIFCGKQSEQAQLFLAKTVAEAVKVLTSRELLEVSNAFLTFLISLMQAPVLPSLTADSSLPFSQSLSLVKALLALIDVVERRSSCDSVTDKLELVGRIKEVFLLPQYLMTAMSEEWTEAFA